MRQPVFPPSEGPGSILLQLFFGSLWIGHAERFGSLKLQSFGEIYEHACCFCFERERCCHEPVTLEPFTTHLGDMILPPPNK